MRSLVDAAESLSYYEGRSESDAADAFCEDCGVFDGVPENLRPYMDTERYVHDVICGGDATFVRLDGSTYLVMTE
mgnify:CR=1 FL=1